jgi:hypothetical protein
VQDAVQIPIAHLAAGPAARVLQKMQVFMKGSAEKRCKAVIRLLERFDEPGYACRNPLVLRLAGRRRDFLAKFDPCCSGG